MSKLLLIDGNSILNRAFYGLPDLTAKDGRHTNAVLGFLNMMQKVIEEEEATHICVAFDVKHPTFRHERYAAYKGTRKPMPEELAEQLPLIKEILSAMNITIVEKAGYEADDILGTLSRLGDREGFPVTILSGDRDLLQLATEKIMIRLPKTKGGKTVIESYFAKDVKEAYGVDPVTFIDMKGLMGDTSDNIPGVPGIGEKTAAKLLAEYGSLDGIYERLDEMKAGKVKDNLMGNKDLAYLSRELATIKLDCEIDVDLSAAKYENAYNEQTYRLFAELDFKSLLGRFHPEERKPEITFEIEIVEDYQRYTELMQTAKQKKYAGFSLLMGENALLGMSLCMEKDRVYLIKCINFITDAMLSEDLGTLCQGGLFLSCLDLKSNLSVLCLTEDDPVFDCQVGAYLLSPLKEQYDYDDIAKEHLDLTLKSRKDLLGKQELTAFSFEEENAKEYMAYLSLIPYLAKPVIEKKLSEKGMEKLYREIEHPCIFTLYDMEKNGIRVDEHALLLYGERLKKRIEELTEEIYGYAKKHFNINSTRQLGEVLFEDLGLKSGKKTKTGYSTSVEVLEKIAKDHPIVPLILEYRQLTKLNSTYVEGLSAYISPDGRIHGRFNQTVTATGRISSTEPNLQNIPTRLPLGREIRKVFIPEDGYVFLDADYSQIELRVLAHLSKDETLIEAYNKDSDIHAITASEVFGVPISEVDALMRRKAKAVNFGIVYGISSFGLGQDLDISRKEAEGYIERYFHTYQKVKEFLDETVKQAKENGETRTMFGRIRPIPELSSSNYMTRSFGERAAMNSPIQGTAADIIKIAMIRVNRELKKRNLRSRLVLQVHDELLIETWTEEAEEVKKILTEEMMGAAKLAVPLLVDANEGKSWYDAK